MSYGERFKQINASIISQKCSLNAQHINVSSNTKQTDKILSADRGVPAHCAICLMLITTQLQTHNLQQTYELWH
jgi:hypothetical protein